MRDAWEKQKGKDNHESTPIGTKGRKGKLSANLRQSARRREAGKREGEGGGLGWGVLQCVELFAELINLGLHRLLIAFHPLLTSVSVSNDNFGGWQWSLLSVQSVQSIMSHTRPKLFSTPSILVFTASILRSIYSLVRFSDAVISSLIIGRTSSLMMVRRVLFGQFAKDGWCKRSSREDGYDFHGGPLLLMTGLIWYHESHDLSRPFLPDTWNERKRESGKGRKWERGL